MFAGEAVKRGEEDEGVADAQRLKCLKAAVQGCCRGSVKGDNLEIRRRQWNQLEQLALPAQLVTTAVLQCVHKNDHLAEAATGSVGGK